MEASILNSVKKGLGVVPEYTPFDDTIIIHINSAFATLHELGVGERPFRIHGAGEQWSDYYVTDEENLEDVKTYVILKTKLLFDPPTSSFLLDATERQVKEYEWRINGKVDFQNGSSIASED